MTMHTTRVSLLAAAAAAGLALSGCVTTDTFDKHVAENNSQHAALSARLDAVDGKASAAGQAAQAAQARADSAYTLAQGKFVMTEVGRQSVNFNSGSAGEIGMLWGLMFVVGCGMFLVGCMIALAVVVQRIFYSNKS